MKAAFLILCLTPTQWNHLFTAGPSSYLTVMCLPIFLINRCFSSCQPTMTGASLSQKHLFSETVASSLFFSKIFQACTVKIPWNFPCPTKCWTMKALKTNGLKQSKFNAVSSFSVEFLHTKYQSFNDKENRYLATTFTCFHSILTHEFLLKASKS